LKNKNIIITSVLFGMILILLVVFLRPQKTAVKRPNVLIIVTDDQDAETLDVYGDTICDTPNIDRLASQGLSFTSAHHMGSFRAAVCTPSRCMLMTGRNVWETQNLNVNYPPLDYIHKTEENYAKITEENPSYNSMPALFKRAGYYTFRTCKRGNSYEGANLLFDERYDKTNRDADDENNSKWHSDKVINYLQRRIDHPTDQPFLIYLGFSHPHDPRRGKPELLEKYGAVSPGPPYAINKKSPKLPVNYLPGHPFEEGHPDLRDENSVEGVLARRDEATVRNERGKELATIEAIDTQIGRVLKKLEKTGELDNTYIFFVSDHGIAVGKHGLMGKQNLYEHSLKIPLIVKGPNIKKNKKAKGNIYLSDVLPTLCDLVGIDIPEGMFGKSFISVISEKAETIRNIIYGVYSGGTKPGIRSLKKDDWKIIKYDVMDGQVRKTQLFNLKENPNELLIEHHDPKVIELTGNIPKKHQVNLADNPKFATKRKEMEELLLVEMKANKDPFRFWDQE
jgi:arylsulfatase A-like enzyme